LFFYCSNLYVKIDDITHIWVDRRKDKIYIKLTDGNIKSTINGVDLLDEFKNLFKILALRRYLRYNDITATKMAYKIKVAVPTICGLFKNKRLSERLEKKINAKFPSALKESNQVFKNPLKLR